MVSDDELHRAMSQLISTIINATLSLDRRLNEQRAEQAPALSA
jgi:hypothetical protein